MLRYLILGGLAAYALYTLFAGKQERDPPPSPPRSHPPRAPSYQPPRAPSPRLPSAPQPRYQQEDRQRKQTVVVDSSHENYPLVETSTSLRDEAKYEAKLMSKCFQQSQEAHGRRDYALAKTLSSQGRHHELRVDKLNAQASAIVFKENNRDRPACEIDLHGLYVKEAIAYSEKALKEARQRGDSEIRLIVGQGNHSDGGVPRLKPAVQEAMRTHGAHVEVNPKNPGVLQVVV